MPVAARDRGRELSLFVVHREREPVELFGDEKIFRNRREIIFFAELFAERDPLAKLRFVDGFVERAHRNRVPRFFPLRDGAADFAFGRGRADGLKKLVVRIEIAKLVFERVVRRVRHQRLLIVIGVFVFSKQRNELGRAAVLRVFGTHGTPRLHRSDGQKLAAFGRSFTIGRMNRRTRRSSDRSTALHLFLESQLRESGARSLRVTTTSGEIIAGVGDCAFTDEWRATWTHPVEGTPLVVAASGGRASDHVALGVWRIVSS